MSPKTCVVAGVLAKSADEAAEFQSATETMLISKHSQAFAKACAAHSAVPAPENSEYICTCKGLLGLYSLSSVVAKCFGHSKAWASGFTLSGAKNASLGMRIFFGPRMPFFGRTPKALLFRRAFGLDLAFAFAFVLALVLGRACFPLRLAVDLALAAAGAAVGCRCLNLWLFFALGLAHCLAKEDFPMPLPLPFPFALAFAFVLGLLRLLLAGGGIELEGSSEQGSSGVSLFLVCMPRLRVGRASASSLIKPPPSRLPGTSCNMGSASSSSRLSDMTGAEGSKASAI